MNATLMSGTGMQSGLVTAIIASIIAALIGSASTLLTQRWLEQPRTLATVDPGILVAEHLQRIDPGMDEGAIEARSKAFAKHLDAAVADVARAHHAVLLVKPSVITGAPDLTDEVRRRVDEQAR